MGVRELVKVIKEEVLKKLEEDKRRRKEGFRLRLFIPPNRGKGNHGLERNRGVS